MDELYKEWITELEDDWHYTDEEKPIYEKLLKALKSVDARLKSAVEVMYSDKEWGKDYDEVDRLIKMYSNPGETVADPFGGVCTTGVRALKHGRKAILTELNETYAMCGNQYLKEEELKRDVPTLFDLLTTDKAA